jgi:hypothetical protein
MINELLISNKNKSSICYPTKCMFATNKLNAISMVLLATIKIREIIKLLKLAIGKNGFYFPYT